LALAIPKGSIIISVNGAPIGSAQDLLATIIKQSKAPRPRRVMVEYVLTGQSRAIEYRIM
jgi:S1-C subfamily serine protease